MEKLYETKIQSDLENSIVKALKEIESMKDEVEKLNKIKDHLVNQLTYALEIKHEPSDNTK